MATEVKIPTPDQTTEEVRIVKWCKAVGDTVSKGETILEIETDKAVLEVEAMGSGIVLQQLSAEDDVVPVGKVVGLIGAKGESVEQVAEQPSPVESPATVSASPAGQERPLAKASGVARKLADKLNVDLAQISGSGPGGKIMRQDVEVAAASVAAPARADGSHILASPNAKRLAKELGVDLRKVTGTGQQGRITGADVKKFTDTAKPAAAVGAQAGTVVPLTKMRRAIGSRLQKSAQERPHFNVTMSIDMTRAMEMRAQYNASRPDDKRLSVNHLIIAAVAKALKQFPEVNSRLEEDKVNYLPDVNIGIATALEGGLVVPVLMNADRLSWDELVVQSKRIVQQAREGKIIGMGRGTFTISNLGMFGVDYFTAIINPPESAILAVGTVKNEVVDIGGGIGIRPITKLTLCSDHRVVDGVVAAKFLQAIKVYLEEQVVCE
jgi:pyruvate dehydrogenase E2 component (dihydrolipoamide acetyltransferase)